MSPSPSEAKERYEGPFYPVNYVPDYAECQEYKTSLIFEKNFQALTDKCLVLDIDETLVHTYDNNAVFQSLDPPNNVALFPELNRIYTFNLRDVDGVKGSGNSVRMWGIQRHHLHTFIEFSLEYFSTVCIWSAGIGSYVNEIAKHLFSNYGKGPRLVYSRTHCEKNKDGQTIKPLDKIYKDLPGCGPENTIILDDIDRNFESNPKNGILIPAFDPEPTLTGLKKEDTALLKLMHWLMLPEVMNAPDLRDVKKDNIFN